jgi:hypothetical protein
MYKEVFILFITFAEVGKDEALYSITFIICRNIRAFIIISLLKTSGTEQETSLFSRSLQYARFNCNWFQTTGMCDRFHAIVCAVGEQVDCTTQLL